MSPHPARPRPLCWIRTHSPMSQKPDRAVNIPSGNEGCRARRHRLPSDTRMMTTGDIWHAHHKAEGEVQAKQVKCKFLLFMAGRGSLAAHCRQSTQLHTNPSACSPRGDPAALPRSPVSLTRAHLGVVSDSAGVADTLAASQVLLSGLPSFAAVLVGIVPPEKGLGLPTQRNTNLIYT